MSWGKELVFPAPRHTKPRRPSDLIRWPSLFLARAVAALLLVTLIWSQSCLRMNK